MSLDITVQNILEEDFFTLLGLQNLPEEEKEEMLKTMNQTVQGRVYLAIYNSLPAEEQEVYSKLSAEEMIPYLEKREIDLPQLIMAEALKYRLELAATFQIITDPDIVTGLQLQEA